MMINCQVEMPQVLDMQTGKKKLVHFQFKMNYCLLKSSNLQELVPLTKNREPDVLGGAAQTVAGSQAVDGAIGPAGLLDQQCALVLIHQFVDVLVVLDGRLLLSFGHVGFLPGERGERAATDFSYHANVTALLSLHGLAELNGGSDYRNRWVLG